MTNIKLSVVRDPATNEAASKITVQPTPNQFGGTYGSKTVRLMPFKEYNERGQVVYTFVPQEPRDTVVVQALFNLELDGDFYPEITKRQLKRILGPRQARKAMKAMNKEDKQAFREWKRAARPV